MVHAVINRDFFSAGFGGLSTVGIGTCSVGARKITRQIYLAVELHPLQVTRLS